MRILQTKRNEITKPAEALLGRSAGLHITVAERQ